MKQQNGEAENETRKKRGDERTPRRINWGR